MIHELLLKLAGVVKPVFNQAIITLRAALGETDPDPMVTTNNLNALYESMTHEVGHVMGLSHCTGNGCTLSNSIMKEQNYPTYNTVLGRTTTPQSCDNNFVTYLYRCHPYYNDPANSTYDLQICADKLNYNGGASSPRTGGPIGGTVPVQQTSFPRSTITHRIQITDYNASTGQFTAKLTDYIETKQTIQSNVTYSGATHGDYAIVDNTDKCINFAGDVKDISNTNTNTPPTYGCPFTKNVSLTFVGTEDVVFSVGTYPFTKVYTGQVTPGSGVPYVHTILYSQHNNFYSYAHN